MELNFSYFQDIFNKIKYFIGLVQDVSEEKELERQIRDQNRRLQMFYKKYTKEIQFASILQRKIMKNEVSELSGIQITTFYSPYKM